MELRRLDGLDFLAEIPSRLVVRPRSDGDITVQVRVIEKREQALQKLAVLVREFAQVLDLLIRPRPEDGLRMPKPRHLLIGSDELVPIETGEVDVLVDDVPLDAGRIRLHLEPEAEWQVFQCFHGITSFLKSCFVGTDSD